MPDKLSQQQPPYCDECGRPIGAKCLVRGEELPTHADSFHILSVATAGTNTETGEARRSEYTAAVHPGRHDSLLERLHQTEWHAEH